MKPFNAPNLINDKSSSGYADIGAMRIQWGISADGVVGEQTVTFPASFANTNYAVSYTPNVTAASIYALNVTAKTTTTFTVVKYYLNSGAATEWGESFNWMAIGLKP